MLHRFSATTVVGWPREGRSRWWCRTGRSRSGSVRWSRSGASPPPRGRHAGARLPGLHAPAGARARPLRLRPRRGARPRGVRRRRPGLLLAEVGVRPPRRRGARGRAGGPRARGHHLRPLLGHVRAGGGGAARRPRVPPPTGATPTRLQRRYPEVRVVPDVLYVQDGTVLTGAGSAAGIDASLHLRPADVRRPRRRRDRAPHRRAPAPRRGPGAVHRPAGRRTATPRRWGRC